MKKDDALYLEHILDAINQIKAYTADGKAAFLYDRKTQDAVIRNLEIIGEAVKNLSQKLKRSLPGVPWKAIAGTRDRLTHGYFSVDLNRVWVTVEKDLPELAEQLQEIAASL